MFLLTKDYYQIKKTKRKGSGVFARRHIPAGTIIGDYLGRVITDKEAQALENKNGQNCYSFEYIGDDVSIFPVDIKVPGVHLINHSCGANCSVFDYQGHNLYFALRHIFPGEELTSDYEFDPEADGKISYCFCESPFCRGTMYARLDKPGFNNKKNKIAANKKNKKSVPEKYPVCKVGEVLPFLKKYPKEIKDRNVYNIFSNLNVPPLITPGKKLPSLKVLREMMRLTGRRLKFPELDLMILAVIDGQLVVGH